MCLPRRNALYKLFFLHAVLSCCTKTIFVFQKLTDPQKNLQCFNLWLLTNFFHILLGEIVLQRGMGNSPAEGNWARIFKWGPGIDSKELIPPAHVARICIRLWSPGINSEESISPAYVAWTRICKRLWSPGIDSEESISPAYVAWRASTTNRVSYRPARLRIDTWSP